MGGIPYTSTGCNTCRRRKVKCDETKPECLRCTKYGHQCTGYDRKKALVRDHTGSAPKKAQRIIPISERASVDGMEIVPRQNLNPELRTQLIATFIESYLPSSPYLPNSTGLNVIQSIPELTGVSTMLEKAVISFSAVHLAKQNHDDRLLHYSSKLYGITLRTLNSRLRVGSKLDQDILYTTVILQFYEMIHCSPSGFMAWIAHVQGSLAVLGQYSGLGKGTAIEKLFHRQLKYVTICDAVVKRKAPYLYKTPAWRGLSSQGDTEPDPLDEFIDQLAECSALLERVDRFFHMQSISSEKANESGDQLLLACLSFEDNLHRLCLSMQGKLGLPMTSSHVATRGDFQDSLHTDLFCGILDFPSLPCAESHLLYWAILVLLYPLIGQLSSFLGRPAKEPLVHIYCDSPSGEAATAISLGTDATTAFAGLAEHYADEICRSVFYFIQPDMKVLGAQMLLAPLSQCVQFYAVEQSAGKLKWSQDVLMTLSHLGLGIAPFLNNIIWPQYLSAQTRKMSTTLQSSNS